MRYRRLFFLVVVVGILSTACSSTEQADSSTSTTEATAVTAAPDTTQATGSTSATDSGDLVVQDGDTVEVHYVGTLDDGSQFDSSRDRGTPFTFTVGSGQVIPGFDEAVRGAKIGDIKTVRIEAKDAYGEVSEENIIDVPYDPALGEVKVGDRVTFGAGSPAIVLEVSEDTVKLDANHPLAGEALTFEIEILDITRP